MYITPTLRQLGSRRAGQSPVMDIMVHKGENPALSAAPGHEKGISCPTASAQYELCQQDALAQDPELLEEALRRGGDGRNELSRVVDWAAPMALVPAAALRRRARR
jgi:hypothetical protein